MTIPSVLYFDNNATTQVDERVLEAMLPFFRETYGNASSLHPQGEGAARAIATARRHVAELVGAASADDVVFTSGGTEADVAGIRTAWAERGEGADTILVSAVEHPAVMFPARETGANVECIAVDEHGRLDIEGAITRIEAGGVALVSVMFANNETGVLVEPEALARLSRAVRAQGGSLQVDAVQALGKVHVDMTAIGADFVSLSAHKFHGPKGVGAWILDSSRHPKPPPAMAGGSQEAGRRAGTSNVPGIVGLGEAARVARLHVDDSAEVNSLKALRDRFEAGVLERFPGTRVVGGGSPRLPNTSNLCFDGVDGEALLMGLASSGLCASRGAACSSTQKVSSPVLAAYGLTPEEASRCLRFSFSRDTTPQEIERGWELLEQWIPALV